MAGSVSYALARRHVERACDAVADDDRTLRRRLLAGIREAVAFDAYAWLLADPVTSVGTAPLAEVPCLARLPELIRLKYLSGANRWTGLDGVGVTQVPAHAGATSHARDWTGLLAGHGIRDVVSVVFRDHYGCWGWLDLWRSAAREPVGHAELAFLADILGPVTRALRSCLAGTFAVPAPPGGGLPGPVVLLLTPGLQVVRRTAESGGYLERLLPPESGRAPVPANAYNVAAQLLAVEAGVDDNPPLARAHLGEGVWVTLRAARIGGSEPIEDQDIAVTIEGASASDRLAVFERAVGLSPREAELLRHLVTGGDTRELAARMFVSEHTVQDYLKVLFAKTSTRSRRALVSRALGT